MLGITRKGTENKMASIMLLEQVYCAAAFGKLCKVLVAVSQKAYCGIRTGAEKGQPK